MMKHFIEKTTIEYDYDENFVVTEFLHENHIYNIPTDKIQLKIAQDVLKDFQTAKIETKNASQEIVNITTLVNIPDITEILRAITEKTSISVFSEPVANNAHELHFIFDGATLTLTALYMFGQIEYNTTYTIKTIKDENVRYLATENFIGFCPEIPTVSRFYQADFCSAKEALIALKQLKLYDEQNCQKELVILDKNDLQENPWYLQNMKVIQILKDHPELNKPEYFHITVADHLDCLKHHLNK